MQTLLVTGGAGFIGGTIVTAALERGWQVRVFDSLRSDVHGDVPRLDPRVEFVRGDVRDAAAVADVLTGIDVVCHQAAKVGLGVDFADAPDYVGSNDLGTAVLLAAMAAAGKKRLVVASSMVVYGEGAYRGPGGMTRPAPRRISDLDAGLFDPRDDSGGLLEPELISEDAPLDPRNVYAITKLGQEQLATSWARSTGGVAAALRYHNVYGPGMPQNTPYAGVASLFRSALQRGEAPRVFEDGAQRRDFVHVRDVASANLAAIEWTATAEESTSRPFNVGSGTVHTIGEMAEQLSRASGGPVPVVTGEYRRGDVRHITASSARLKSELGWKPSITFEEGMREFATAPLRAAVQ
ncbi:dTDP-L-rhamnose 4-epimerase [Glaciihabitans tibetensis]|uniref:UDP-glucose 4-epimerase n=1 Tax=Glaciihabitans tibetensis TaxID=1266600 RepID=A0A2T0VAT4_9MICO|nr:NAD-dependent epimerase/dehydratase family protein [Glaciihabitans tibetensis]PRY67310.1 dTDP-L-rhamnose 4-epimerase [Glaciihabitans tibetensis]